MSKENMHRFMEKAAGDSALQEKLAALEQQHFEKVAALAKEAGFEIAPEDFTEDAAELSDDEMEKVAGGLERVPRIYMCPSCGKKVPTLILRYTYNCPNCGCEMRLIR